jgi:repressor LexA
MKGLTDRQQQILDFIRGSIDERGYPPTIREIGRHMGIRSTNGVNDHLKALERKGFLRRDDLKSRAMRPVELAGSGSRQGARTQRANPGAHFSDNVVPLRSDDDMVEVPVVGRVAAGQPILAQEHVEDTVRIDRFLLGGEREVFALRIQGESMIEDGIFDGDFVFVKKTPVARPGEIVIALIEDEATCKRYYPEGERIRFQPANSSMEPIYVRRDEFRETMILGSVIGIYRQM